MAAIAGAASGASRPANGDDGETEDRRVLNEVHGVGQEGRGANHQARAPFEKEHGEVKRGAHDEGALVGGV